MIDRNDVEDVYSLSPLQEGMLFHHILEERSTAYFVQTAVTLNGEMDVAMLERTFNKVIEKYDILRTVFTYKKTKKPRQVVLKYGTINIPLLDISHLGEETSKDFVARFREKDLQKGFDLAREIPMRVSVLKIAPSRFIMVWSFHHIVMDGWCLGIIFKDVMAIYRAFRSGEPVHLKPATPYKEYIMWLEKQDREKGLDYWKNYLEGCDQQAVLPRISEAARGSEPYYPCEYRFVLHEEWTAGLNRIAMENRVTVNSVFQALWGVLLQVYNNADDVVFGAVVSNRPAEIDGIEEMVGLFINTVPVRVCAGETTPFSGLVLRVQENAVRSKVYEYFPLAEIQAHSSLNRRLIDHILAFENYPLEENIKEQSTVRDVGFFIENSSVVDRTHYDFTLVVGPGEQWTVRFSYNGALYDDRLIRVLEGHLKQLIRQVVDDPRIPIGEIDILTEDEKNRLLYEFNDTAAAYPGNKTIHELFAAQVKRSGDRVSVLSIVEGTAGAVSITYNELNRQADRLACLLIEKGVTTGAVVGIMVERSLEMAVGVLGILKAGGAYLPIDPGYPQDRVDYMLKDSGARIIINKKFFRGSRGAILQKSPPGSANLAYIIYTSGSTGKPKGVMVEHRNVVRLVKNTDYIDFKEEDRILQTGALEFDASSFEIWGALLNGLSLCLVSNDFILDPGKLKETVCKYGICTMWLTSPLFNRLSQEDVEIFGGLRSLLVGGDVLSPVHISRVRRRFPRLKIINGYGPTENTTFSTTLSIEREYDQAIPIGAPIANSTAYIIGRWGKLAPIGVPGELIVGGDGVARGYLNNPELTAERFKFNRSYKSYRTYIFYKTGDLARWLVNGTIEFLGRIDQQVKIRGFRIEVGEIEHRLLEHNGVIGAVVIAKTDSGGNKYLCAYIVPGGAMPPDPELREYLSRSLPDYMLPSFFVHLETIPLTPNGKVDRGALPGPGAGNLRTYFPPRNEIETLLTVIWQEVLGIKMVGIADNFFEIGGDSIKAIQVSARLKKHQLGLKISDLFTHPTIDQLAGCLTGVRQTVSQEIIKGEAPLTPIQHWFYKSNFTHSHHFNQAVMLYSENGFDETYIKEVFTGIVSHHDALRMVYRVEGGALVQENRGIDGGLFDFELFHLEDKDIDVIPGEIEREAGRIQASIDLAVGPLVKLGLFKTSKGDHLLIVIHHLVVDGISWRILLEDFSAGYKQAEQGETIQFPPKTTSFKEWACALTGYASGTSDGKSSRLFNELDYWKSVEEAEVEPLPRDRQIDPAVRKNEHLESIRLDLDAAATETLLRKVNWAYNTEISDILLAALGLSVNRWLGNRKVLINLEGHGRESVIHGVDITRTVGWFTTQYPVILDMDRTEDLPYTLKSVKETLRRIPNRGIGYGILKYLTPGEMKKGYSFERNPEIGFNYLGEFGQEDNRGFIKMSGMNPGRITSPGSEHNYAISINGMVKDGQLSLLFSYNRNEYDKCTIEGLSGAFESNLLRILQHCSQKKEKELTPSDLGYTNISIDDLSRITGFIKEHLGENHEIEYIYSLSPMQGGMFFQSLKNENSTAYFEQGGFTLAGTVNATILEESFSRLIARYDIFRTVFLYEALDEPLQVVIKKRDARVHYKDITHLAGEAITKYLEEYKRIEREHGFNLSKDLLMKMSLFKTGNESYYLLWNFHHILMDGWCLGIVYKELIEIYLALAEGKPVELGAVTPYRNYINWLAQRDKTEGLLYWEKYLEDCEQSTGLPRAGKILAGGRYKQEQYLFTMDDALSSRVIKIAGENQVTVNIVFQTLWGILLQRYNNCNDVVFGAVVSGRPPEVDGIETIIGLFINTVPVRIRVAGDREFSRLLMDVRENAVLSKPYEYLSLAEIQSNTPLKGNLIDHIMVFENYPVREEIKKAGVVGTLGFEIKDIEMLEQTHYDFDISVIPGKRILINFSYNALVYQREFIENTAQRFERMLKQATENPAIAVQEIELLSEEEKDRLLYEFNNAHVEYPEDKTIPALFEAQAARTPDAVAVKGPRPGERLTYRQLNETSDQLARQLRAKGVIAGTVAAIKVEPSLEMITGIWGIWKAGGAYLPIDPEYPEHRINYMLKDSGAKIMIGRAEERKSGRAEFVFSCFFLASPLPCFLASDSSNLAYIIYTSGSTGKSKGVMIEHRSITVYMFAFIDMLGIDDSDIILQQFSICFDASTEELYPALLKGGSIVVVSRETVRDIHALAERIESEAVTIVSIPSLLLNELDKVDGKQLRSIRAVVSGGDVLKAEYITNLIKTKKVYNGYGPTETTVGSTFYPCSEDEYGNIPIGTPIANSAVFIVSGSNNLSPIGVPGELWIGGSGLARGYLNRVELTNETFIANPFREGELVYKTGDLARWIPAAQGCYYIEFLGRIDHQVKIRGYRIEPGEIETLLTAREDIKEAIVLANENSRGDKYLCAYVAPSPSAEGAPLATAALSAYLSGKLPHYMVPSYFVQLSEIPLTPGGKVNLRALPDPGTGAVKNDYVAPTDGNQEILARVWKETLGLETVGIRDNFFQIGGDSIKAIQVSARLKKHKLDLKVNDLFENPTIEALAGFVRQTGRSADQHTVEGEVELTPIQRWFFENNFTSAHHFNQAVMIYSDEGFDQTFVEKIFTKIIEHHDALRMTYKVTGGKTIQFNRGYRETDGKFFDLHFFNFTGETGIEEKIEMEAGQIQASLNLETGPLVKLGLFKTSGGDHLLMVIHHLAVDGISWRILLEDFSTAYRQLTRGEAIGFQEKTDSFKCWAAELREYSESKEILRELEYWEAIETADIQPLPVDYPVGKGEKKARDVESLRLELNKEETEQLLTGVNQVYNTEINDILLTALGMAVKEWCGVDTIMVNLEAHGREPFIRGADVNRTVGWFTAQFPVVLNMSSTGDLSYNIKYVKETLRRVPNNGIGYGLLRYLTPHHKKRGVSFTLNPGISFNYLGQFHNESGDTAFTASPMKTGNTVSPEIEIDQSISVNGMVAEEALTFSFAYNRNEYKRSSIEILTACYKTCLLTIIRHCAGKGEEELTPSDLGDKELSLEDLDQIQGMMNL